MLLVLLLLLGNAPGQGRIVKFLRDSLTAYAEDGTPIGKIPAWKIVGGVPIVGIDAAGRLGVKHDGKTIFLRVSEVEAEGVDEVCAKSSPVAATGGGRHVAAAEGVASGMGRVSMTCVPQ